ncbi:hypothetical protein M426DRAFT_324657 [Hypoxylon sp. CI-4A]|nr:hypothetical protein M426DRAFT_324657 [Hypoxylon sp. CI-4A]
MQFTSILAAAATLAFGANAAAVPRDGARLAQFRIFGAEGCSDLNYGFYTVDESDIGSCHSFEGAPDVKSVNLEAMNTIDGATCSLYVYTNNICTSGLRRLDVQQCTAVPPPNANWASWQIFCPPSLGTSSASPSATALA